MDVKETVALIFQKAAREQKSITLQNTYRSIPISNEARVLGVSKKGVVRIQTHEHQILCLNREASTIITGKMFPGYVKAKVNGVNFQTKEANLVKLEYISEKLAIRETLRVSPKDTTHVWLVLKETGFRIKCEIDDLSAEGMAIRLPIDYYVPNRIRLNAEVILNFQLQLQNNKNPFDITARALIRNTLGDVGSLQKRIGLRVYYNRDASLYVVQYVQQRAREIAQEMDFTYNMLLKLQKAQTG